jgi:hypothetical protein
MTDPTIDSVLFSSSSVPAIKFETVGDKAKLKISAIETRSKRDFQTGEPVLNKAGQPMPELVITGTDMGTGEEARIYASKWAMILAIKEAAAKAGMGAGTDLTGCMLTIHRREDAEPTTRGFSGAHQFVAKLEAGKPAAVIDDII